MRRERSQEKGGKGRRKGLNRETDGEGTGREHENIQSGRGRAGIFNVHFKVQRTSYSSQKRQGEGKKNSFMLIQSRGDFSKQITRCG